MPELIFRGWRRLLHNQRAVYVKRLLLFEPRVILVTVPYRMNKRGPGQGGRGLTVVVTVVVAGRPTW